MITKFVSLSQTLCYIFLEHLVLVEINSALSPKESSDHIFKIVTKDIFIRSLVALCVEIVLFAHNSQKTFPWITEVCLFIIIFSHLLFKNIIRDAFL